MEKCKECGAHPRVPGEMYDTRERDVVGDLYGAPIKVAKATNEAPGHIYFLVPSPPQQELDGTLNINLNIVDYVRLDRIPEPLRDLVKTVMDAMDKENLT